MKILVIIPTYNEKENIQKIITQVLNLNSQIEVLIVDDNSPDGTGEIVEQLSKTNSRLHILHRQNKRGLGTAYVLGFKWALQKGFDYIFEMDADFSHDPQEVPKFLEKMKDYDLVLGSRYTDGVNVVNWPMGRLLLSYFANKYARFVTGIPVQDLTSGFKCFRREVLEKINLDKIHSNGYAFQIEMTFKAWQNSFKIGEIPIIFVERREGKSKMSKRIIWEAAWMVWRLRISHFFG